MLQRHYLFFNNFVIHYIVWQSNAPDASIVTVIIILLSISIPILIYITFCVKYLYIFSLSLSPKSGNFLVISYFFKQSKIQTGHKAAAKWNPPKMPKGFSNFPILQLFHMFSTTKSKISWNWSRTSLVSSLALAETDSVL